MRCCISLRHWTSAPALTPLAPEWKIPFWVAEAGDVPWVAQLSELVLQRVPQLQQMPAGSDGNTGLGSDSITARFAQYNLLQWEEEAVDALRGFLAEQLSCALEAMACPAAPLRLQCWANVLNDGQRFERHVHTVGAHAYLSGNLCLSASSAATVYSYIHDEAYSLPFPSRAGQLVLFPSYLPHSTTPHRGSSPRISLGMDVFAPGLERTDRTLVELRQLR